jgi:hypothetical protein
VDFSEDVSLRGQGEPRAAVTLTLFPARQLYGDLFSLLQRYQASVWISTTNP